MPRWTPPAARCRVFTFKQGVLASMGHDLELDVARFEVTWEGDAVEATFDPRSLRTIGAVVGGRTDSAPLSAKDRSQIDTNTLAVLEPARFPAVRFTAGGVGPSPSRVAGWLDLHGVRRSIGVAARREPSGWVVEAVLQQPEFGITPFSALLGALKVKPEVRILLHLPV